MGHTNHGSAPALNAQNRRKVQMQNKNKKNKKIIVTRRANQQTSKS
jgi:hypothetical protein